jgi:hypothetical protein
MTPIDYVQGVLFLAGLAAIMAMGPKHNRFAYMVCLQWGLMLIANSPTAAVLAVVGALLSLAFAYRFEQERRMTDVVDRMTAMEAQRQRLNDELWKQWGLNLASEVFVQAGLRIEPPENEDKAVSRILAAQRDMVGLSLDAHEYRTHLRSIAMLLGLDQPPQSTIDAIRAVVKASHAYRSSVPKSGVRAPETAGPAEPPAAGDHA